VEEVPSVLQVLQSSWALLLGLTFLMLGNGMQNTVLGIRGGIEGFSTMELSVIMSGYFAGFLVASKIAPMLIRRVGHVRVFAALGSLISATIILYPVLTEPWAWVLLRVLIGFCFCGVYITAESWLNAASTNETRGKALSLYMIVVMLGIVLAQGIVTLGDPSGFILFIVPSVLVSIAFAPILLAATPTPPFETTKSMSLARLWATSPLGCVAVFLTGGVISGQFTMSAVYGGEVGLTVAQISAFIAAVYMGGLVFQFPLGWLSDRMDRRKLILWSAVGSAAFAAVGMAFVDDPRVLIVLGFLFGGLSNPLYSLAVAYTNDFLDREDMAAASGGLLFLNGLGAVMGPIAVGWIMGAMGAVGFWVFLAALNVVLAVYAVWRMRRRPLTPPIGETFPYAPVPIVATPVSHEAAAEVRRETQEGTCADDTKSQIDSTS
jgi:MFS family permease